MFALIVNHTIQELFDMTRRPEFHADLEVIEVPSDAQVGWMRPSSEEGFQLPPPPPPEPRIPGSHDSASLELNPDGRHQTVGPLASEALGYFGNIWVRAHHFAKAGDIHRGHTHNFDHVSFLTKGSARVTVNDIITDYSAINFIVIDKGQTHSIQALEDQTEWWCVWAVRDTNGDVMDILVDPTKHNPNYFANNGPAIIEAVS